MQEEFEVDQVRKRIRAYRESQGLRAEDVAKQIGVSRPFYTQLESGARGLSVIHLFKIAKALKVTIGEICGEDLKHKKLRKMRGYLIPVNNPEIRNVLTPLLSQDVENATDWAVLLREAAKKLKQLENTTQTTKLSQKAKHRIAG